MSASLSRPPSMARRLLRLSGKLLKWGTVACVVLLAAVAAYARVLHRRDAARWKAPGRVIELADGRKMHIYCTGAGTPTTILEAGLGDFSISSWSTVQPDLAKITRTCSYDRAGTGWSDPPAGPPTANGIVEDLHALLGKSGEPGPYLMVGHSLGGPLVRHYAVHYPAEVAGLVLVDGSHEEQLERLKGMPAWVDLLYKAIPTIHFLGIDRVASQAGVTDTISALGVALTTTDKAMHNTVALAKTLPAFMAEVKRDVRDFGALPLVALTAGKMEVPGVEPATAKAMHDEWVRMHQEIVARSSRGQWILAERSTHYIQRDQPELVIGAVRDMVDTLRSIPAAPHGAR